MIPFDGAGPVVTGLTITSVLPAGMVTVFDGYLRLRYVTRERNKRAARRRRLIQHHSRLGRVATITISGLLR